MRFLRHQKFSRAFLVTGFVFLFWGEAHAAVAVRFSLAGGEEYNDNIFFDKKKSHDFITFFTPTLTLLYAPPSEVSPTLSASISPSAQTFARHGGEDNFGKNLAFGADYFYPYNPVLNFHLSDRLRRVGETRSMAMGEYGVLEELSLPEEATPFSFGPQPAVVSPTSLVDFINRGDTFTNDFSLEGTYLGFARWTFQGGYSGSYVNFMDDKDKDDTHSVFARGTYYWNETHRPFLGYGLNLIENQVTHSIQFGDDYFSTFKVGKNPTLRLSVSAGVGLNTGGEGPGVIGSGSLILEKLWPASSLTVGVWRGFTSTVGVSGLSETNSAFGRFHVRLLPKLSASSTVVFSQFKTDETDFDIFQFQGGLHYWITSWLSSTLRYIHRWRDAGKGATPTSEFKTRAKIDGNSAFLFLTAHFSVWPTLGLAEGPPPPASMPGLAPPELESVPPPRPVPPAPSVPSQ